MLPTPGDDFGHWERAYDSVLVLLDGTKLIPWQYSPVEYGDFASSSFVVTLCCLFDTIVSMHSRRLRQCEQLSLHYQNDSKLRFVLLSTSTIRSATQKYLESEATQQGRISPSLCIVRVFRGSVGIFPYEEN